MAIKPAPRKGEADGTCSRWDIITRDIQGKQKWQRFDGTLEEAKAAEAAILKARREKTQAPDIQREVFEETIREYLSWIPKKWNDGRQLPTSASTLSNYAFALKHVPNSIRGKYTALLTAQDFEREVFEPLANAGKSKDLIMRTIRHLRPILNRAKSRRQCAENPLQNYVFTQRTEPGKKIKKTPLSEQEFAAVLAAATPTVAALVEFRVRTGVRLNEALGLRKQDVDLERGVATIHGTWNYKAKDPLDGVIGLWEPAHKTGSDAKHVILPPTLVATLTTQMKASKCQYVFATGKVKGNKRPMGYRPLQRAWTETLAEAKVEYRALNSCRVTYASMGKSAGFSSHVVGSALGHAKGSQMVDKIYKQEIPDDSRRLSKAVNRRLDKAVRATRSKAPSNVPGARVH